MITLTNYIPVSSIHDTPSAADLEALAEHALNVYNREVDTARKQAQALGKKPVILLESLGLNDYIAYDLTNNKPVMVMGYKTYEDGYHTQAYHVDERSQISDKPEYYVAPPTPEYIHTLGLDLSLNVMEHPNWWDAWREEPPLDFADKDDPAWCHHTKCVRTYNRLVKLINIGRQAEYPSLRRVFGQLESDLKQLENLKSIPNAPDPFVNDLLASIRSRVKKAEQLILGQQPKQ